MHVAVYTAICQEDDRWVDQYLAEMSRLSLPFAVHFDRCGTGLKQKMTSHELCIGCTAQDNKRVEFTEQHKQGVLDLVAKDRRKFHWAMPMDIDETWEKDVLAKLERLSQLNVDYVRVQWLNLWGDPQHVRVDPPFKAIRDKMYNLRSGRWQFNSPVVNGPHLFYQGGVREGWAGPRATYHEDWDTVCLHWGLMTRELREEHKARWDRVYTAATKKGNPYGMWDVGVNEEKYPPRVEENPYYVD